MRHLISIELQNESGALNRVAGLFASRGYNIESLSVAATQDAAISRISLVTLGDDTTIAQVCKQLNKLVDVVTVENLTAGAHIERELLLVKIASDDELPAAVKQLVEKSQALVVLHTPPSAVIELTASGEEVNDFLTTLSSVAQVLEVVRSGVAGMKQGV